MAGRVVEQEFVAHVFAPLDGPAAATAERQVRALWDNCRTQLGMTQPILGANLPGELPAGFADLADGAVAGLQDPEINFQAVVRREHDVLNLSLVMATPVDPPRRRRFGLGTVAPPGWPEFGRWWAGLTSTGTGALLGVVAIHQAKARRPGLADLPGGLPARDDDGIGWWTRRSELDDFAVWEATAGGDRAGRRLVVVARPDEDSRLSRFTWSNGGTALPPLGRYLMHAAKVRYHARVLGDARVLSSVRERLDRSLDEPRPDLAEVAADEADLIASLAAVKRMRHSVEIARDNMDAAMPGGPLPTDDALAKWLAQELSDQVTVLETTLERAGRMRAISASPWPPAEPRPAARKPFTGAGWSTDEPTADLGRVEQRLAFGVDVVGYSSRTVPQQHAVQRRLADVAGRVLDRIEVALPETDRQDAGDGMMVVLPARLEAHRVLPGLLGGWRSEIVADNAAHPGDRIRVRLSVVEGPFARAAIGFSGNTIIEAGRLLDSAPLRAAVEEHAAADLVALISDRLHDDVVVAGHEGVEPAHFTRVPVRVKDFSRDAWLWLGGARPATPGPQTEPPPRRRDVFLIHGADEQARQAVGALLTDLDLRPLDWDELSRKTGVTMPYAGQILDQAFVENQAAIVVLTPGDGAERDVLFRAGMAMARQPDRTIVVELGPVRPIGDLAGRQTIRITADEGSQRLGKAQIIQLLRIAGCTPRTDDPELITTDHLAGLAAYHASS
ncbi:CATRA conflict system CASPASE/TPR repeat-associated protein [Actinoplanes sp. NPDC051470]|uniref:CATRA conflict system CASPASE/TPR repeat-associated protein n=1 Tax=Actinoplanes sp. NPDC051470 TaxID=3157224 RepID=UPI0034132CAF